MSSSSSINNEEQLIDLYNQIPPELVTIIVDYIPPIEFRYTGDKQLEWIGQFTVGRFAHDRIYISFGKNMYYYTGPTLTEKPGRSKSSLTSKIIDWNFHSFGMFISGLEVGNTERIQFGMRRLTPIKLEQVVSYDDQLAVVVNPSSSVCYQQHSVFRDIYWIINTDPLKLTNELLQITNRLTKMDMEKRIKNMYIGTALSPAQPGEYFQLTPM